MQARKYKKCLASFHFLAKNGNMYDRIFKPLKSSSYFLFGPRSTGKSSWLKTNYPKAIYFDLLDETVVFDLQRDIKLIESSVPSNYSGPIIIDEVQKLPKLLDEIHRLIEKNKNWKFILSGSSARKLKRVGTNLLAGRALYEKFFPLTSLELGNDFDLIKACRFGMLPQVWTSKNEEAFLKSYILTYIDQEVKLEGFSRNIPEFHRFLEAASFSQGQPLNISKISSDCGVERRTVTNYFNLLEDLLISYRVPVFSKRAKRELITHNKFYFFDAGVFHTLRPRGPLDSKTEILGAAIETLVFQHLMAYNNLLRWNFEIYFWHTRNHIEVDFILYGPQGFYAIEVKTSSKLRKEDFVGLLEFKKDFKEAELFLFYGGDKKFYQDGIHIIPLKEFFDKGHNLFVKGKV